MGAMSSAKVTALCRARQRRAPKPPATRATRMAKAMSRRRVFRLPSTMRAAYTARRRLRNVVLALASSRRWRGRDRLVRLAGVLAFENVGERVQRIGRREDP